jgi:Putative prokaryotic signal transducing protein
MSAGPTPDPELVTVFDTQDEPEAMVVHALLTSAGIESLLSTLQAQQDVLPGVGGIVLRVNPAQADEARRVIEEYRNAPAAEEEGVEIMEEDDQDSRD